MKPANPSKKRPFMAYIDDAQHVAMGKFSKKNKIPMSQLVREAIAMRIAPGSQYVSGFNDGLNKAMQVVADNKASQMRFPSGKSFAELIADELKVCYMGETNESP